MGTPSTGLLFIVAVIGLGPIVGIAFIMGTDIVKSVSFGQFKDMLKGMAWLAFALFIIGAIHGG